MTTHHALNQISEADVRAFAEKLATWMRALTPTEQALLGATLIRAATQPDDAEGFRMSNMPNESEVGGSGGSGSATGDLLTIGGAAAAAVLVTAALPAVLPGLVTGASTAAVAYVYSPVGPFSDLRP